MFSELYPTELHPPEKNLVFGEIQDGMNPSQPVGAWYRENKVQRQQQYEAEQGFVSFK